MEQIPLFENTNTNTNNSPKNINESLNIDKNEPNSNKIPKNISELLNNNNNNNKILDESTLKKTDDAQSREILKFDKDDIDIPISNGSVKKLKNMWQEKINSFLE